MTRTSLQVRPKCSRELNVRPVNVLILRIVTCYKLSLAYWYTFKHSILPTCTGNTTRAAPKPIDQDLCRAHMSSAIYRYDWQQYPATSQTTGLGVLEWQQQEQMAHVHPSDSTVRPFSKPAGSPLAYTLSGGFL